MIIEALLYSGNVWLIIGLILAILELTNGTLIVFLPTGLSGLLTGLVIGTGVSIGIVHAVYQK